MTDAGISALGAGCDQLQSIIPKGCKTVSDADISALGAGCDQLQSKIGRASCRERVSPRV